MGQEFFVKSDSLESQVRKLLPSQGGLGAGQDLSASTQIIPIIDLTETAEGSTVRPDLQTALSFNDITAFDVNSADVTIINTTGYFRVFGNLSVENTSGSLKTASFVLSDGSATKVMKKMLVGGSSLIPFISNYDFVVFIPAGGSLLASCNATTISLSGCTKQIASIDGTLTQPS